MKFLPLKYPEIFEAVPVAFTNINEEVWINNARQYLLSSQKLHTLPSIGCELSMLSAFEASYMIGVIFKNKSPSFRA